MFRKCVYVVVKSLWAVKSLHRSAFQPTPALPQQQNLNIQPASTLHPKPCLPALTLQHFVCVRPNLQHAKSWMPAQISGSIPKIHVVYPKYLFDCKCFRMASRRSSGGGLGSWVSNTIFILPLCGVAVVLLHRALHRLFIYNVFNATMIQRGDDIINFWF